MNNAHLTIEDVMGIIADFRTNLIAPVASKLSPGGKINGVLFDGTADIEVAPACSKDIELLAGKHIGILYDNNDDDAPGLILTHDGLYFHDGTNWIAVIRVERNASTGAFTISAPATVDGAAKTLTFSTVVQK